MIGMWRGLVRGARVVLPVVLVGAIVQGLLVVGDPTPHVDWVFALRVVVSGLVMIVVVWLIVGVAATAVDADAGLSIPSIRLLIGVTSAVVGGALAGVLSPILPIVVAVAGLPVLSALAVRPWTAPIRMVMVSPFRTLLGFVLVATLFIVIWVTALLLGFFIAGPVAAMLTWVVFGFSTAIAATYWAALHRRSLAQDKPEAGASTRTV